MGTAIISGIFAFIGTCIALYVQRRTIGENWLLQKRAEAFAKFMVALQEFENEQLSIDENEPEKNNYSLAKIYTSANIVCLYLPERARNEFRENFDKYMKFVPDFTAFTGDIRQVKQLWEPRHYGDRGGIGRGGIGGIGGRTKST